MRLSAYKLTWAVSIPIETASVRRPFILNNLANQSQILCWASSGRGNQSLYKWARSHDQDGPMPIYGKNPLENQKSYDLETWLAASDTQGLQSWFKRRPWNDLELFYVKVKFGPLGVWIKKLVA